MTSLTNIVRKIIKIKLDEIQAAGMKILAVDTDFIWFST